MGRTRATERHFQKLERMRAVEARGKVWLPVDASTPPELRALDGLPVSDLTATELTADTCCALGVHSQWCGCEV